MLIDNFVEVSWHKLNKDYYESKGYEFTRQRDRFLCKIEDLSIQSKEKVNVQCDFCGKIHTLEFKGYVRNHKDYLNHIYECRECEIKRIWNNIEKECNELNFKLLSTISDYKTHKTKISFICNIHPRYGIQYISVNGLLSEHYGCKLCTNEKKRQSKILEFEIVKLEFEKNDYILCEDKYINAITPMKYICPYHPKEIKTITYDKLSHGQGCNECGNEKIGDKLRYEYNYIKKYFDDKGLILLEKEYKNNSIPLRYLCKKHIFKGEQTITFQSLSVSDFGCNYCAIEYRSSLLSKGGITPLHNYLRGKITNWNKDSMVYCNYQCALTGERFHTVHHLYGFNKILIETLEILNLPIYNEVNKYSKKELELLEKTCVELHYKYGYGICLCGSIHNLFHTLYSKGNNTPKQFNEFAKRYKNFEFDDLLEDKYKYKNVLSKVS